MRVLISAEGPYLDSPLGINFARSPYFLVVDTETLAFTALKNPWSDARGGAGFKAARIVADQHAEAVITGTVGPNAYASLTEAGVAVFTAPSGAVRNALRAFRAAHLSPLSAANAVPYAPFRTPAAQHATFGSPQLGGRARRRAADDARQDQVSAELGLLRNQLEQLAEEVADLRQQLAAKERHGAD